ncbi:preprotein translocase subunit SecG [Candidatus Woesebacteria bacterium RIFOXYA1_FULL_43_16]|nr:MAG: preprotein translocase subunit SecG [Candidatus Woesebacteria bacterium RIFOXYA1_FULL_43_16]
MKEFLTVAQIASSIALIGLILIQARGTGFGRSSGFGGGTSFSRRGLEKLIFRATFIVALAFVGVSMLTIAF